MNEHKRRLPVLGRDSICLDLALLTADAERSYHPPKVHLLLQTQMNHNQSQKGGTLGREGSKRKASSMERCKSRIYYFTE